MTYVFNSYFISFFTTRQYVMYDMALMDAIIVKFNGTPHINHVENVHCMGLNNVHKMSKSEGPAFYYCF